MQVLFQKSSLKFVSFAVVSPVFLGHSVLCAQGDLSGSQPVEIPAAAPFDAITIQGESADKVAPWATARNRDELDSLQIESWSDLARRAEPGINFNQTNKSLNVRGLDQNRVLTRIDGIRQTWLGDATRGVRGGLSTFDFNALSAIDIVRGADSSVAGSGALGGVVDVRTLNPSDLLADGKRFGTLLKGGYASLDQAGLTSAAIATETDAKTQWLVQAGLQKGGETGNMGTTDGYGVMRTAPNPADYLQQSYLLKLRQPFEGGHTVGLSGAYFERQENSTDAAASTRTYAPGQSKLNESSQRESVALDYGWRASGSAALLDEVEAQLYWQRVSLSSALDAMRVVAPSGSFARDNSLQEATYGLHAQASKAFGGHISQLWSVGAEWYGNTTEQSAKGRDTCPKRFSRYSACNFLRTNQADMPRVKGSQAGIWAQNSLGFAENQFTLIPGLRYDHYQQSPGQTDAFQSNAAGSQALVSATGSAVSPKIRAVWSPLHSASVFAQYAFGFNAPSATQLYTRYGSPGTYLIAGNPDLKPETSRGWEVGTKLGDERLNGALTYFDNSYRNFIELVTGPGTALYPYAVRTYENQENVRISGIEARGNWKFSPGWRVYGSVAWAEGVNQTTGLYLNSVAPLTAIAGLAYEREQWGAQAQLRAVAARNQVAYPSGVPGVVYADFQAPGYGTADLTAYWKPGELRGLWLQAGVYNVFNKTYWNALSVPTAGAVAIPRALDFYTAPGRSVQVSLIYQY